VESIRFSVRVTPRGGADRVDGVVDGILRVRVAAPAVDDAANRAMVRLIAADLNVAPSLVHIVRGGRGRNKGVTVDVAADVVRTRWPGIVTEDIGGTS
jgi:uncharacterized protein YggU (UPF0235/DUF167 family)